MMNIKTQFFERMQHMNWWLAGLTLALSLLGLIMMVSAGGGEWAEFAAPQSIRMLVGLALMMVIALLPMRQLYRYAYVIFGLLLLLLIGVDVVGHIGMGAKRWIRLGSLNIQPSEFMKIAVILALARYYHNVLQDDMGAVRTLSIPILMILLPAILILRQPNLGTAVITVGVGLAMLFFAGVWLRYFAFGALAIAAAAPVGWHFLHDYQKQRVLTFLDPEQDPLGAGYNILQSQIAIGSGGFWGKGFLNGTQGQLNFLPEKHTDFIFTMFAEEWGFAGGILLLGGYAVLLLSSTIIAARSRSVFGRLLAAGVSAMLFLHILINIAMVMGLLPVVGLPLPFLSYGGSITLAVFMAMGLLLNAYVHRDKPLLLSA